MNESPISPKHGPSGQLWIVEFTEFRVVDEAQRQAIDSLDRSMLDRVVDLFLQVVTPGAYMVQRTAPGATIVFPSRRAGRRFIAAFGGRWVRNVGK